jgi:hypothetical protein
MESNGIVRRISSSSQTWNKGYRESPAEIRKKIQVTSFKVPFGKISLSKKVNDKDWERQNKNIKERYYPAVLSRNQGYYNNSNKSKWKSWADEVFSNLPKIGPKSFEKTRSIEASFRVKKKINLGEDYHLFNETPEPQTKKHESHSMHKTFYDVIKDLYRRKKEKKEVLGYYY